MNWAIITESCISPGDLDKTRHIYRVVYSEVETTWVIVLISILKHWFGSTIEIEYLHFYFDLQSTHYKFQTPWDFFSFFPIFSNNHQHCTNASGLHCLRLFQLIKSGKKGYFWVMKIVVHKGKKLGLGLDILDV